MRDYASLYSCLSSDLACSAPEDTHFYSDMSPGDAARSALAASFYKKLCPTGNTKVADTNALTKFRAINDSIPDGQWVFAAENEAESCFYDYFKHSLASCLQPNSPEDCFGLGHMTQYMMVGPGAAQKADSSYMVSKLFESTMSYTNSDLVRYYRAALIETGLWADAEMCRFQKFGFVHVEGAALFFAPKNADISRVCATEANLNMIVQNAIRGFLEARLVTYFGISLSTQPDLNRELARLGSVFGSYGTTDLVSASDCIGNSMFTASCPDGAIKAFIRMARSEHVVLPDGTKLKTRMVSTMGNAFTFPLQTIIFASVVKAVYQLMEIPLTVNGANNFGVFGDDIIVVSDAYEFTNRMLERLGFVVNVRKSFNTGPFRESCGHDYFAGVNIRGVYIVSLESPQQVYSAINRLLRWSVMHDVALPSTIKVLRSWARDIRVPPSEQDDAGLHYPFDMTIPRVDNKYWFKYRAYQKRAKQMTVLEPDSCEPAPINSLGLAVGYLSGHIRRRDVAYKDPMHAECGSHWHWREPVPDTQPVQVSIREPMGARPRYKIVSKIIPYWDYIPLLSAVDQDDDHRRLGLTSESYTRWKLCVAAHMP